MPSINLWLLFCLLLLNSFDKKSSSSMMLLYKSNSFISNIDFLT
ncbi:hypothetical protein A0H76_3060 [Hepatospora eriocheir]|uniref:Uncharacterized protein n=1 Tax=Hepatospora eriocheir TaxID=1081669 RepID=A0A1X0QA93_9MICR|nr:hypothetical protein A0H76_3060 [Hepatospora eriocheir]